MLTRCRCAQPSCVYARKSEWSRTHVNDPAVKVRVRWITETRKYPAYTLLTGDKMYLCKVNVTSRAMICTLSSADWRQASKLSVLRRFELIYNDWDKAAYQSNTNDNNGNNNDNNNNNNYYYYYIIIITTIIIIIIIAPPDSVKQSGSLGVFGRRPKGFFSETWQVY